jgi:hypothetical protein
MFSLSVVNHRLRASARNQPGEVSYRQWGGRSNTGKVF